MSNHLARDWMPSHKPSLKKRLLSKILQLINLVKSMQPSSNHIHEISTSITQSEPKSPHQPLIHSSTHSPYAFTTHHPTLPFLYILGYYWIPGVPATRRQCSVYYRARTSVSTGPLHRTCLQQAEKGKEGKGGEGKGRLLELSARSFDWTFSVFFAKIFDSDPVRLAKPISLA